MERKKELDEGAMDGLKRAIDEKSKLEGEKYRLNNDIKSTDPKIKSNEKFIVENEAALVKLREEWNTENQKQFVEPDPDVFICPTCEQSLPQDKKESRLARMRLNFEQVKSLGLSEVNTKGKEISTRQNYFKEELESLRSILVNY